ncbi:unnamed protein product, partial [Rotaria magnacalcarata]
ATLVQCIAQINITNLPELINCDIKQEYDQIYLLINHITKRLDNETQHAKINLLQAAKNGPMYGCSSGINALLTIIYHDKYENQKQINEWRTVFDHLIKICLEIASITGPIVSSSSPEGMMPMELTDISSKDEDENSNGQITSQMLLVCCWETIITISSLRSNCDELCNLPITWIENGIKMVQENSLDKNKLCLTRRSGGLPFYLQSILTDEPIKQRGQQRTYVAKLMETLLNIIQNDPDTIQIDGQVLENSRK